MEHSVFFYSPPSNARNEEKDMQMLRHGTDASRCIVTAFQDPAKLMDAVKRNGRQSTAVVVAKAGMDTDPQYGATLLGHIGAHDPTIFTILYSYTVSNHAASRLAMVDTHKIKMVSHVPSDINLAIARATAHYPPAIRAEKIRADQRTHALKKCTVCGLEGLTEQQMWQHVPMYHVNCTNDEAGPLACPVCSGAGRTPMPVHLFHSHAPKGHEVPHPVNMTLHSFGLAVIQRKSDKKFLLVQEFCNQGFWLPGGAIDAGEFPVKAAERECVEEVGVEVQLTGILRVEVSPNAARQSVRSRYIFYGHPKNDAAEPKTIPDFESAGACWLSIDEILSHKVRLRGDEPVEWCRYVAEGMPIFPMSMLTKEGAPAPRKQ